MPALSDLLDIRYWFTINPGLVSDKMAIAFVVFFSLFIIAKLLLRFMGRQYITNLSKYHHSALYRIENACLTMGLLGLLWTFLSYETIPFFSGRFWFLFWGIGLVVWAYIIFYYIRFEIPAFLEKDKNRAQLNKYLPKKMKR